MIKATGKIKELIPAGTYQAVCYRVYDLGMQESTYDSRVSVYHKINIGWELAKKDSQGRPFTVHQEYTLSLGRKSKLLPVLEAWLGKKFKVEELTEGYDPDLLVGKNCLITIIHTEKNGNVYANVGNVTAMMDTMAPIAVTIDPAFVPWWITEKQESQIKRNQPNPNEIKPMKNPFASEVPF